MNAVTPTPTPTAADYGFNLAAFEKLEPAGVPDSQSYDGWTGR